MTDKKTKELHQENRILRLWFFNLTANQSLYDAHELIRLLLKSDEFPRGEKNVMFIRSNLCLILDYFSFIKRLMELLRMFTRIRKIELEIQTINQSALDIDHPSRSRPFPQSKIYSFSLSNLHLQPNDMLHV